MVITAWEIRKLRHRLSVEHSVQNALEAGSALNEQNDGVARLVLRVAERVTDPRQRATLLSGVARILSEAGRKREGIEIFLAAMRAAKLTDRDTVLQVLGDGATTLASADNGELLWRLCLELERVDDWFRA
jgi:hypothetical protein